MDEQTKVPAVLAAIVAVNKAIAEQGIAKADKNTQQNFSFRGVDRVYDAMAGLMAEHNLLSTSRVLSCERAGLTAKSGGALNAVYLHVEYTFKCAVDASEVSTDVVAEAFDSGDKATAKAMSVAHRTALLQLSMAPVNPAEPDADSYEVAHNEAAPPVPLPEGFSSEEESQAAHNEAAALWRTLPEDLRPEIPKVWPTTRDRLGAFNAQINAALATALGASEPADGPSTPPESPGAQSGAEDEPELPPAGARSVDTPDIGSIQHEPDIEGPSVFNGDTGHCAECGGPIWYDRNHWVHAEESDDVPMHNEVTEPADAGVDVDALYAAKHPPTDPKIAELKVKTEVGKMSGPKVLEALTAANLSTAGPPPKLKERLVEHRLSVLANTP